MPNEVKPGKVKWLKTLQFSVLVLTESYMNLHSMRSKVGNDMKYATVDEVIEILKKVSNDGHGDYEVICNGEYWLAKKGDKPAFDHERKFIDLGGYI